MNNGEKAGTGETKSIMNNYETVPTAPLASEESDIIEFELTPGASLAGLEYLGADRESRYSDPKNARTFGEDEMMDAANQEDERQAA